MTQVLVEEHGCIRDGPREVDILAETLWGSDTVLQRALVEHVGREFRQARMHAVLHLQTDRPVPKHDKAFEEGLGQSGPRRFLVHDHWA